MDNVNIQFSSVAQSRPTLCNPMDCSMPGFPVHHQLPEPTQTHVHLVGNAIQPTHPLSSPSPPAFNLSLQSLPNNVKAFYKKLVQLSISNACINGQVTSSKDSMACELGNMKEA